MIIAYHNCQCFTYQKRSPNPPIINNLTYILMKNEVMDTSIIVSFITFVVYVLQILFTKFLPVVQVFLVRTIKLSFYNYSSNSSSNTGHACANRVPRNSSNIVVMFK